MHKHHQLANGLYVSGPQPAEAPVRDRCLSPHGPVPYTGGDVTMSGELGRMFDIPASIGTGTTGTGIGGSISMSSARISSRSSSRGPSGSMHRPSPLAHSGPLSQLQHSGLLVGPSPGQSPSVSSFGSARRVQKQTVKKSEFVFGIPFYFYFLVVVVLAAGVGVGIFFFAVLRRLVVLIAAGGFVLLAVLLLVWNLFRKNKEVEKYLRQLPDTLIDRTNFPVGELVKITGHVTCDRIPLTAPYHDVARCIFTSIDLYEYQESNSSSSNLCNFKWEMKHSAKHVANFYISDNNTGRRYLVRAGESTQVSPFVNATTTEINKDNQQISPDFLIWLEENNLSSSNKKLRIKEGFIKEGDSASVIGILKQHHPHNIIDPPGCALSTGCQWKRCMFPLLVEGLVIIGDECNYDDVIVV